MFELALHEAVLNFVNRAASNHESSLQMYTEGASRSDDNGAVVEDTAPKDAESINV